MNVGQWESICDMIDIWIKYKTVRSYDIYFLTASYEGGEGRSCPPAKWAIVYTLSRLCTIFSKFKLSWQLHYVMIILNMNFDKL